MSEKNPTPLFSLGRTVATPGALDRLDRTGTNAAELLHWHQCGEWGVVCPADAKLNDRAVSEGARILSAYELGAGKEKFGSSQRQTEASARSSRRMSTEP